MPEYSQIETYIRYNNTTLNRNIESIKLALNEIGFDDNYIQKGLEGAEWKVEENGFVYSLDKFQPKILKTTNLEFCCTPHLLGWTPAISKEFKESWLGISLLYDTEEITLDYHTGKLKVGFRDLILDHMKIMSKYFSETGTYFTDEVTQSMPWEALIGIGDIVWGFDMAIIPIELVNFYINHPTEFNIKHDIKNRKIFINHNL